MKQPVNHGGTWVVVVSLALLAAPIASAERTNGPAATYESDTAALELIRSRIAARLTEVDQLKQQALREGQALRVSCIDEKLRRIREARDNARVVRDGWSLAKNNRAYAERSMDKMRLFQLIASTATDEAYLCVDARAASVTIVRVDTSVPEAPAGPEVPKPPVIERPPLASPF